MPTEDQLPSESEPRERRDHLVRQLTVAQDTSRPQSPGDDLEAIQRQLEPARNR